jgi:phosphopantetheinyl transferase (holo-ACP synthase)
VTTSLTWTFNSRLTFVSCGIDSEHVARFGKWRSDRSDFLPFVFTKKERSHCRLLRNPAAGLCSAFCVKEALLKALCRPYDLTDCEFLYHKMPQNSLFSISGKTGAAMGKIHPAVKFLSPVRGQMTAIVYLLGAA